MENKRRPLNRKGDRNALCPHYRDCLDDAVKKSWQHWDCEECTHKLTIDPGMDILDYVNDSVAYYDLPTEIYVKIC